MVSVTIPTFEFSGFYYGEILEDLVQYLRDQGMDIDESPEEPFIQLLRAFALSAHLNNVLLDMVANEGYLPTAKLRDSVKALLALIDYQLAQPSPATATLVSKLTKVFTAADTLIPDESLFATRATVSSPPIEFETTEDHTTNRTDKMDSCLGYDAAANAFTDQTGDMNNPAIFVQPAWGAGKTVNDAIYIGHQGVAFDKVRVTLTVAGIGIGGVWEYYNGDYAEGEKPDNVTDLGTGLRFELNDYLGGVERTGTIVRVFCSQTGAYQDCAVSFVGGVNRIDTVGASAYLGQTVVSLNADDYTVGRDWNDLPDLVDNSNSLTAGVGTYDVDFTLPKDDAHWWIKGTVSGVEAYWVRFRIIVPGAAGTPTTGEITIDDGDQFVFADVTQGRAREDNPLASSTGLANQAYTFARYPVIDDANIAVYVTEAAIEEEWTRVDTLLTSSSTDKHYRISYDSDGRATVTFGDGTYGKIPAAGVDNIRSEYRTMNEEDGNVGANTIIVNRGGVPFLANVTNPRNATGYSAAEGSTEAELERLKVLGPEESLRTMGRATSKPDVETLTESYTTDDGSDLFSRCLGIEGAFGPKTIEAVCVKTGGEYATVDELADLDEYFNGDTTLKVDGIIVLNQQVTSTNYVQKTINVTATLYGGDQTTVESALRTLLHPEAKELNVDGTESTEWQWEFGETVPVAMIINAAMQTDPKPRNFVVTLPAADVVLTARELPLAGILTITYVP